MLSSEELTTYNKDGYLFPKRVLTKTEAAFCKSKLDKYFSRFGEGARGNGPMTKRAHIILRWAAELARHPSIVDSVADIIGSDILCWSSAIFTKESNSENFVSWHQDANYWGLSSSRVVSAWVALTTANVENGCMRFLPGSHKNLEEHNDITDDYNMLSRGQTMLSGVDEKKAVNVTLKAGEYALFHVNLAHSSLPNGSTNDRIGFVFRYIAGDVYQTKSDTDSASLIRGRDLANIFEHEPMPREDFDPECLAFHERVCQAREQVYFDK